MLLFFRCSRAGMRDLRFVAGIAQGITSNLKLHRAFFADVVCDILEIRSHKSSKPRRRSAIFAAVPIKASPHQRRTWCRANLGMHVGLRGGTWPVKPRLT